MKLFNLTHFRTVVDFKSSLILNFFVASMKKVIFLPTESYVSLLSQRQNVENCTNCTFHRKCIGFLVHHFILFGKFVF